MKSIKILLYFVILLIASSCKKLIDIGGPKTSVSSKDIYQTDATAMGALTNLYANLGMGDFTGTSELSSLSCIAGLSADELTLYVRANMPILTNFYQNVLTNQIEGYWRTYSRIYEVNAALEGLENSTTLSPLVKQHLLGEARFMRGFYYFYLINLYGDIPLVLSTDYKVNSLIAKSKKDAIYQQIKSDLKQAVLLLSDDYLKEDGKTMYSPGNEERVRPNKWTAIALLARVYLYDNDWPNAEMQADLIIEKKDLYSLVSLDKAFIKNNKEAIWQLQCVRKGMNTMDASIFLLPSSGPSSLYPVYLNEDIINNFEIDDQRLAVWTRSVNAGGNTYFYPYKYRVLPTNTASPFITEYSTVMRLAEQFLIRSEARLEQGNVDGAISDIDEIRKRAGLPSIKLVSPNISKSELETEILKQRRFELFTEWGHRWLDLKRTRKIDEVMSIATIKKGNNSGWKGSQQYYPIPLSEVNANPNLTPTEGY